MNNRPTLSIAPYYGGKGRMAHFIADRFDYSNSHIFVTPFGGMCRELLNKPRHKIECYNDYNSALCALMTVLADHIKADEFIHRLYDETEFDEQLFYEQKAIYDSIEIDMEEQEREKLRQLLIGKKLATPYNVRKLLNGIRKDFEHWINDGNNVNISNELGQLQIALKHDKKFKEKFQNLLENWYILYIQKELYESDKDPSIYIPRPADMGIDVSDIDLAIATYVVFTQSRDGMGKTWSKEKFKSSRQYKEHILRLYDCAERLEGINVYNIDALDFFRHWVSNRGGSLANSYVLMNQWVNNPDVMMYCDPSYISRESEEELLRGIDIKRVNNVSNAIKKKFSNKHWPKNLGEVYSRSFGYMDQELFLRCIRNAKCKMMVSNYDLQLYNKYLNPDTGWRREEFQTTTSVGGRAGNTRTEVIWYNY